MSEVTRITTIEITEIFKNQRESDLQDKTEYGKELAEDIKNIFGADNVVATNVQDFVREMENVDWKQQTMNRFERVE